MAKLFSECISGNASLSGQWAVFDQDLSVEVSPSKIGSYALTRIASEGLEKLKKLR